MQQEQDICDVDTQPLPPQPVQKQGCHPLFYIGLILMCAVLLFPVMSFLGREWQSFNNSLKYGYPRTYHIDANVGHGDRLHPMSHFVAFINQNVIEVVEIPGDQGKSKAYLYLIARITGENVDQIPVTLTFVDVAGHGKLDMEVIVNNSIYVLYNTGTTFTAHDM